ncbi:histidine phosphatase family protein [Streptomyces sp. HNM0663]|uniref:Histidine phosphatase family protein n=1 Tax=Streptomyces chengmaiensis TaxID=3040919 RepID=A0ABT6HQI3_9ACTN|nr:histidine phosphatase family protein [Streptomyces chengmaiensis]MDH2390875.1 histidine phosphatase family protein [Streptomyces chengmaiensis]
MADIWLMRHGAYEGHRPGYHAPHEAALTLEGRDQVRRSLPLPDGITAIVTSPIPRACQTAMLIAHLTSLPIVATSGFLAEWRAPSIVLGRSAETYPPAYRAWRSRRLANPSLRCEDGESLTDLHTRARHCAAFLHHTAGRHGPLLAVSHTLLLGVLTRLPEGPTAFTTAASNPWHFAERRRITPQQSAPTPPPCSSTA